MLTRACLILVLTAAPAGAFEIGLPIGCDIGTDCFIQNYLGRDDGPGAQDYACGAETYDGRKGTDIRRRSTADVKKGVPVLTVAPGIVAGTRDSMPAGAQRCGPGRSRRSGMRQWGADRSRRSIRFSPTQARPAEKPARRCGPGGE